MMKRFVAFGAVFAVGMAMAQPAFAHHNSVIHDYDAPECEDIQFTTSWKHGEHRVDNTQLVVNVDGEVSAYDVGEMVDVDPSDAEIIAYRIWGGGERDYDSPELDDLDVLVEYLEEDEDHSPLDVDAPGVTWHPVAYPGCDDSGDDDNGNDDTGNGDDDSGDGNGDDDGSGDDDTNGNGDDTGDDQNDPGDKNGDDNGDGDKGADEVNLQNSGDDDILPVTGSALGLWITGAVLAVIIGATTFFLVRSYRKTTMS